MDVERVCCMCGDVGFPDKIFRCIKCHHRFQHSYCSNSYSESSEPTEVCEWCRTDEIQTSKDHGSSKKPTSKRDAGNRSENSVNKIKQHDREESNSEKGKPPTGAPSPRTSARRYKLLKDVMF
ncbi:hypothetical protein L1987_03281 [Smallanthus sonchifolius]|uniref:Uncharacterized protein n=1 Tax=Smallanthus sonchifolius TaxID=185202 RepID=A0ACB9KAC4_9ASTR|nr:hypothetical protein L1987_03281 [Smallanthus sonchifolius]